MAGNNLKTIIVTGANTGLGFALVKKLCADGYDVILACRSEEKAKAAVDSVKYYQPTALATQLRIDLADFGSVRKFVDNYHALDKTLYALVCNAGLMMPMRGTDRQTTNDGHEVTMQANYLGHFLLTNLLLEDLKAGAEKFGEARVVNVSSTLQDPNNAQNSFKQNKNLKLEELNLENFDLQREGSYTGINAYMNSKSAQIMSGYTLAQQLEGANVLVNSVAPGFIPTTDLSRNHGTMASIFMKWVLPTIFWLSGRSSAVETIEGGANRIYELTASPDLKGVTGKYFAHEKMEESKGCTNDTDLQKALWEFSLKAVGLDSGTSI